MHPFNFLLMERCATFANRLPSLDGEKVTARKQVKEHLLLVTALASFINLCKLNMKAKSSLKMAWDQIHPRFQAETPFFSPLTFM